jgi:hypothetical protein
MPCSAGAVIYRTFHAAELVANEEVRSEMLLVCMDLITSCRISREEMEHLPY